MNCKVTSFAEVSANLFPENVEMEKIADGYRFTEGPVWDSDKNCLYFTDFQDDRIYCWTQAGGAVLYRDNAHRPIGLSMSSDGRIISTESSMHRIAFSDSEKSEVIAQAFQGKRFNSPNDVVAAPDGSIWFTDPYSTAMGADRELDINGVYRILPDRNVLLACGSINRPNGIAFSPDGSILYVNDTDLQQIFSFDILTEDEMKENELTPHLFAELDPSYGAGAPDGMKTDVLGNVWVTGPGGIWVISPEGKPIAILHCPEFVGNFCFGGDRNQTLFITASTSVYKMNVNVQGIVPVRI